ncbi:hypothetical protein B566_EDAN005545 [Ephemera danica]|nr:hypothetical protein B566_EDAN005545 [Ephemera danica]
MALDFAATYKVLVLGDSNVGKTCIVHRYCDERYYDTYISTIGIDFKQKIINLDGTPIKLQICLESFNHLSYWLRNIQENASPDVIKVLVGNKCDANSHRCIAENFEMPFFEVSCKQNINIEEAFLALARNIREQREKRAEQFETSERSDSEIHLSEQKVADAWKCNC